MKTIKATLSLLLLGSASAIAADLPSIKSVTAAVPTPIWTGFYAGLNAGGTWTNNNNIRYSVIPGYMNSLLKSAPYQEALLSLSGIVDYPINQPANFIGGGQIGYNFQIGNDAIIGVEADIQGIPGGDSTNRSLFKIFNYTYTATATGLVTPATTYTSYTASKSIDYIGTVRGRVGLLARPTWQIYGSGGLAYGNVNLSSFVWQEVSIPASDEFGPGNSDYSATRVGWTAGGGIEWMSFSNWSLKAEYLYYNLGSVQLYGGQTAWVWNGKQTVPGVAIGDIGLTTNFMSKTTFSGNIIRAGINYHFNLASAPVVAKF